MERRLDPLPELLRHNRCRDQLGMGMLKGCAGAFPAVFEYDYMFHPRVTVRVNEPFPVYPDYILHVAGRKECQAHVVPGAFYYHLMPAGAPNSVSLGRPPAFFPPPCRKGPRICWGQPLYAIRFPPRA